MKNKLILMIFPIYWFSSTLKNRLKLFTPYLTLIFITLIGLSSCKKKDGCCTIDNGVNILVLNQQSQNLFSLNVLNKDNIEVFYLNDGKEILQKDAFTLKDINGQKVMSMIFTRSSTEKFPVSILKFGNLGADTIKAQMLIANATVCQKLWVNGQLKYDSSTHSDRLLTLIK